MANHTSLPYSDYVTWLITPYAKNEVEKIPTKTLKAIREALEK